MNKSKTKIFTKDEIMSRASLFALVDLKEEGRTAVMKVVNPFDWHVIRFDLDEYAKQSVKIKFSADVKRTGASGTLCWQINNNNYPALGRVSGANKDVWHKTSGEWSGFLENTNPTIYLNTWRNDSERSTFYIDKVTIEVTLK